MSVRHKLNKLLPMQEKRKEKRNIDFCGVNPFKTRSILKPYLHCTYKLFCLLYIVAYVLKYKILSQNI